MPMLRIQIIFADKPEHYWSEWLSVEQGTTIQQAIASSQFQHVFSDLSVDELGVGVFGLKQSLHYVLKEGERVELYRGLTFDPKISRKRRAIHRKAGILKKKHLKPDRSKRIEYDEHTEETK